MHSSSCQAEPLKKLTQLVGSAPGAPAVRPLRGGCHQYQSRLTESGPERESTNQGCSSEVWLTTRSMTNRIPRACIASSSSRSCVRVPNTGSTSW